jgi:hypothetical protein
MIPVACDLFELFFETIYSNFLICSKSVSNDFCVSMLARLWRVAKGLPDVVYHELTG